MSRSRALLLAALAGCASTDPAFRERLLATVPEEARVPVPVVFSADGRKAAWVERRGDVSRAVSAGWRSDPYGVVC